MIAYYNEHDPQAAAWLRELIKAGLIAPGEVDERDIQDVLPTELTGFTQCHFFAGIGVWSYALRRAGWPDDRRVWTGSCPCQPFSSAGKGAGFDDERHLWPAWFHLIRVCRPDVVFGEQVSDKGGPAWLDLVLSDLEAEAFKVGALDLCAAGAGAPHIRPRFFFVADSQINRASDHSQARQSDLQRRGAIDELADPAGERPDGRRSGQEGGRPIESQRSRDARGMADSTSNDQRRIRQCRARDEGEEFPTGGHGSTGELADSQLSERRPIDRSRRRIQRKDGLSRGEEGPGGPAGGREAGALADSDDRDAARSGGSGGPEATRLSHGTDTRGRRSTGGMAQPEYGGCEDGQSQGQRTGSTLSSGVASGLGNAGAQGLPMREPEELCGEGRGQEGRAVAEPGPTNGFWRNARWIYCKDDRYRPIEPGTFPLVGRATGRVGRGGDPGASVNATTEARTMRLRGYGNAIVAPLAEEFIRAYLEIEAELKA